MSTISTLGLQSLSLVALTVSSGLRFPTSPLSTNTLPNSASSPLPNNIPLEATPSSSINTKATTTILSPASSFLTQTPQTSSESESKSLTTSALDPAPTIGLVDVPGSLPPVIYNLVIDLGACANLGSPKVVDSVNNQIFKVVPLGINQFNVPLEARSTGSKSQVYVFLADDNERCGSSGACARQTLLFDRSGIVIRIKRSGSMGLTMYPFSIWMDDGQLIDGTPVNSQASEYRCWGGPKPDCPLSEMNTNNPGYIVSTSTPNATVYVTYCPMDGPTVSSAGREQNSSIHVPSAGVTGVVLGIDTIVPVSTFWSLAPFTSATYSSEAGEMATQGHKPTLSTMEVLAPSSTQDLEAKSVTTPIPHCVTELRNKLCDLTHFSTSPIEDTRTTSVIPISTPVSTATGLSSGLPIFSSRLLIVPVRTTLTDLFGIPIATSTISAAVIPALSALTDSRGSTVASTAYNLTTTTLWPSPTPLAGKLLTLTYWTTNMAVNGSMVPMVGGQLGVLTTTSAVFVLQSDTTIALNALSSISVESMRTSLPSASGLASAGTDGARRESTVAAAIIGLLVGFTLLGVLLWVAYAAYKRLRQRAPDYAVHRSPIWNPVFGPEVSHSADGVTLDLDSDQESFIEPWIDEHLSASNNRKTQREMREQSRGVGIADMILPTRHTHNAVRPSKVANRVLLEQSPEPIARRSPHNDTLPQTHSPQESDNPPVRSSPDIVRPSLAPNISAPAPSLPVEGSTHNIIPPLYNEAWNMQRSPPSE